MQQKTPAQLHAHAAALWQAAEPDDTSAHYERADGFVAGVFGELGTGFPRRPLNWARSLHRYEHHGREGGRAPRENTRDRSQLPPDERRMAEWARYQRRFSDTLCRYQQIRLDLSPVFQWDPHQAAWQMRLHECKLHRVRTGGLPYLNQDDPHEFALARWLGRQFRQLQYGTLSAGRALALSRLLDPDAG
ncbi:hypothetical protein [Microterricola pindariensis]|uniref:Helicase-associated domain-containing protein n=1 Tax=Microterricola pindariensis TaxID=478010 RepID=A0ABX5AW69_9MICO|nr:hypothetical protein [Microterricola pindariensis]PPL18639.1 hypothetical protein GY24_10195 [Microterricola pindariensis]